jgi:hypothetical protein
LTTIKEANLRPSLDRHAFCGRGNSIEKLNNALLLLIGWNEARITRDDDDEVIGHGTTSNDEIERRGNDPYLAFP